MAEVITAGEHIITPTILREFTSRRRPGTIVHEVPGREFPPATVRPAGSRHGRMMLGFEGVGSEVASDAAERVLAAGLVYTLTVDGRDTLALRFVVVGEDIERELDDASRDAWTVTFGYREVAP